VTLVLEPPLHAQELGSLALSLPPDGRALPLLFVWDKSRSRAEPQPAEPQSTEVGTTVVTDENLLARLQEQDAAALHTLFERYARIALGIALRILRDAGEAEDVAQKSFLYIYQRASLFDPQKGNARSWIIHIVYQRAFDRRGYLTRRGFYGGTNGHVPNDALLGTTDLDREVGSRLDRELLETAISELEERQRRTLELFYFEGLELREISEVLGEPLGNIRHHYYRGLQRLRKNSFVKKLEKK
jgi:RNA polymerase sigma-70 factor, ECF subfamily